MDEFIVPILWVGQPGLGATRPDLAIRSTLIAEVLSGVEMTVTLVVSSLHHIRKGYPP